MVYPPDGRKNLQSKLVEFRYHSLQQMMLVKPNNGTKKFAIMKTYNVSVTTKLVIEVNDSEDIEDVLTEMDYSFKENIEFASKIVKTEITNWSYQIQN